MHWCMSACLVCPLIVQEVRGRRLYCVTLLCVVRVCVPVRPPHQPGVTSMKWRRRPWTPHPSAAAGQHVRVISCE